MNRFLASLDNNATPPVNASSTLGAVVWPSPFYVHSFSTAESIARAAIFGSPGTRMLNFTTAIQLLWVVENSVLAARIVQIDPIVTYTESQLIAQFSGVDSVHKQAVTAALVSITNLRADFLPTELASIYQSAFSKYDKLAALVTYFGTKTPV